MSYNHRDRTCILGRHYSKKYKSETVETTEADQDQTLGLQLRQQN